MRVIVVGAGVIGMTSAYYLSKKDCEVTVIDRREDAALETSFANGGQLSYSFSDALGKPAFVARIPGLLFGRESGASIRLNAALIPWGLRFLAQCTRARNEANTVFTFKSALRSAELMQDLRDVIDFDFCFRDAGKMVVLDTPADIAAAEKSIALKAPFGGDNEILDPTESIRREPAIGEFAKTPLATVYSRGDELGDAQRFASGMRDWLQRSGGVRFLFDKTVDSLLIEHGRITGASIESEIQRADAVVVCSGVWTNALTAPLGVKLPIYPMRGYSVTLPVGSAAPSVSITSLSNQFVFTRLGERMRIAGFADFCGFDVSNDQQRVATLLDTARRVAPNAADYGVTDIAPWGAFRPMTPYGRPFSGATDVPGLYVNAGHGMLGWTLACDSGYKTALAVTENR